MRTIFDIVVRILTIDGLVMSFLLVALIMLMATFISKKLTRGRIHASAIAILLGLTAAYIGGRITGGSSGMADITAFSGVSILGGAMLRDFTLIATAFGAKLSEIKKCGPVGIAALLIGETLAFTAGAVVAVCFGYTDAVSVTTIGAGAVSFIVGPVTGSALGASSQIIAISLAAGVVKSIAIMVLTPVAAKHIGLTTPRTAMIYGGLVGSVSGVSAGLAATDPELVPYGAMVATFYSGLGCILCPLVFYLIVNAIL